MSSNKITIKPNNHRVHPCPEAQKIDLLKKIISLNSSANIVVVTSQDKQSIKEALGDDTVVLEDREFIQAGESCEFLISYNVPTKDILYIARVELATSKAVLLVDESEQKKLHFIEMLLGRAIKQEIIAGFEYEVEEVDETPKPYKMSKEKIKEVAKKRYEEETLTDKQKEEIRANKRKRNDDDFKKPKGDDKWAKSDKKPNKFLGKDDKGKAIFSGKSGDRNHKYDGTPKEKYGAPKKVGRKISVTIKKDD